MLVPADFALLSRRVFLGDLARAGAVIGLSQLLARDGLLAAERPAPFRPVIDSARPCAPRAPQFPAKAVASAVK